MLSPPRFALVAALCAMLLLPDVPARAFGPSTGSTVVGAGELALARWREDEYAEGITFLAYLKDGSRVEIGAQVSNLGIGNQNGRYYLGYFASDRRLEASEEIKHKYRWESTPLNISMGDELPPAGLAPGSRGMTLKTVAGGVGQAGHTVEIAGATRELALRLRWRSLLPAYRPGDGRVPFGDRTMQMYVQMPRAEVSGQLWVAGRVLDVVGIGYMEHSRANADPRRTTDRQLRLRFFDEVDGQPLTVIAYDNITTPKDGERRFGYVGVWLGTKLVYDKLGAVLEPGDLRPDPKRPKNQLPGRFTVNAGPELRLRAKTTRLVDRTAYLEKMSALLRAIISSWLYPVAYNWDCETEVTLALPGLDVTRRGWSDCGASLTRP